MTRIISTTELGKHFENPDFVIVDVRPMAAYNGWQLQGEARGGHIRGAVACPLSWIGVMEAAALKSLLKEKGIAPDKTVVIYGYSRDESAAAVNMLLDMGYDNVLNYEAGLVEWAVDDSLPMARLANYEKLVHPVWVHSLIKGQTAATHSGNGFALFHVTSGVPEEYEAGHIPGAMHLDTNTLESAPSWNRLPDEELEAALLAHGITHNKTIVLYGRRSNPNPNQVQPGRQAGQIAATRAAAILMYAGVKDVRLLDGGFDAWVSVGYEVETTVHEPIPVEAFGAQVPGNPDYIIDLEEAKALLDDPNGVLVSIRTWQEFIGETSGYNYIGPVGRIAGAVWGNCGSDAYSMQHYRNVDNTMREYNEIAANWRSANITPDKKVAFYCGTGWRASETFFYAYLMGWENVSVYDGGWLEWSQDPSNAIEIGEP